MRRYAKRNGLQSEQGRAEPSPLVLCSQLLSTVQFDDFVALAVRLRALSGTELVEVLPISCLLLIAAC